jgi:hypothetical protein
MRDVMDFAEGKCDVRMRSSLVRVLNMQGSVLGIFSFPRFTINTTFPHVTRQASKRDGERLIAPLLPDCALSATARLGIG